MATRSKLSRDAQRATAFYAKGPYSAYKLINAAVVHGPDDYYQSVATIEGAHRLVELLNHAHKVATEYPSDIVCNHPSIDAPNIVAWSVAKSLGWRLELPQERKQRLQWDAEDAARKKAEAAETALSETKGKRGGPTIDDPNRPYCKPDQSCCDFVCGN